MHDLQPYFQQPNVGVGIFTLIGMHTALSSACPFIKTSSRVPIDGIWPRRYAERTFSTWSRLTQLLQESCEHSWCTQRTSSSPICSLLFSFSMHFTVEKRSSCRKSVSSSSGLSSSLFSSGNGSPSTLLRKS